MKTTTHYPMVDISNRILPKEVKNEIMEIKNRNPFEKNLALRKQLGKKPVSFAELVCNVMYIIAGVGVISLMIWGYLASNGGY